MAASACRGIIRHVGEDAQIAGIVLDRAAGCAENRAAAWALGAEQWRQVGEGGAHADVIELVDFVSGFFGADICEDD